MRLGLGTVQFGLPYGATNRRDSPDDASVRAILVAARDGGIKLIDTAASYGASETVLGRNLPPNWLPEIVTKTPVFTGESDGARAARALESAARTSAARLGGRPIYGLLVHHGRDLAGPVGSAVVRALEALKGEGFVRKIGVSVYDDAEIDAVLKRFRPDIVQLPVSLADRQLVASGHIARLADLGVEIHARSVFLQGTLLAPARSLPAFFDPLRPLIDSLESAAERCRVERAAICLAFIAQTPGIAAAIVGVTTRDELIALVAANKAAASLELGWADFPTVGKKILDPSGWPSRDQLQRPA